MLRIDNVDFFFSNQGNGGLLRSLFLHYFEQEDLLRIKKMSEAEMKPIEGVQMPVMESLLFVLHMDEVVGLCGRQTYSLHFQLFILTNLLKLT